MLFSKDTIENFMLKNSFRVLKIKISFLKKIICNHILISLHPSRLPMKILVLNKTRIKIMVPNRWDNSRLNSCISIGELVKPLHKKIFSKLILLSPLLFVVIMSIYFLGIIYKMYVIIDDFVYFDNFCYAN